KEGGEAAETQYGQPIVPGIQEGRPVGSEDAVARLYVVVGMAYWITDLGQRQAPERPLANEQQPPGSETPPQEPVPAFCWSNVLAQAREFVVSARVHLTSLHQCCPI